MEDTVDCHANGDAVQGTVVSSWNEWDPLKHVIVGRATGSHIPPPEPALDAKVPEDSDMRGMWGQRSNRAHRHEPR